MSKRRLLTIFALLLSFLLTLSGCVELTEGISDPLGQSYDTSYGESAVSQPVSDIEDLTAIPPYDGTPYVTVNGGIPNFSESELTTTGYETYAPLDSLGRCGVVIASLGPDTMPAEDEERGSISHVYPSGWKQAKYDFVDGKYLYNRSHLIGWQLSAENDNERNLITGTRYMNVDGMLPFENMVADYIKETENHVAYRVTPVFVGNNLVCTGVQIEAYSIEDEGEGICFNVFCYNVQPGVTIRYETGDSFLSSETPQEGESSVAEESSAVLYVLNTGSKKIHKPTCGSVKSISDANRKETQEPLEELLEQGYTTCGNCFDD